MARYQFQSREERQKENRTIDARAPMADPSANIGAPSSALTWANTFRNRETGATTSPWAANVLKNQDQTNFTPERKAQVATLVGDSPTKSIVSSIMAEIAPTLDNPFAGTPLTFNIDGVKPMAPVAPPPLSVLANGGQNASQRWMSEADKGMKRVSRFADMSKPMRTTYGAPPERDQFGWGSAFAVR